MYLSKVWQVMFQLSPGVCAFIVTFGFSVCVVEVIFIHVILLKTFLYTLYWCIYILLVCDLT